MSIRVMYGLFKSGIYQEETACHPNKTVLLKYTNYTELCDMTYINSGMSYFCGKPKDEHLLCEDWELGRFSRTYPDLHLTACDEALLMRLFICF